MLKRMLCTAILTAVMQGCWSAAPSFAQDQKGQTMQTEKKMGQTMMKDDEQQMMHDQKHPHRMSKKKHVRKMSKKNSNKLKSGETNRM